MTKGSHSLTRKGTNNEEEKKKPHSRTKAYSTKVLGNARITTLG